MPVRNCCRNSYSIKGIDRIAVRFKDRELLRSRNKPSTVGWTNKETNRTNRQRRLCVRALQGRLDYDRGGDIWNDLANAGIENSISELVGVAHR